MHVHLFKVDDNDPVGQNIGRAEKMPVLLDGFPLLVFQGLVRSGSGLKSCGTNSLAPGNLRLARLG